MIFYSQYKQDEYIYNNFFKNKTNGFFIDIGASEPERQNNTLFFEKLGWDGILVEPVKKQYDQLIEQRKSPCETVAIYKETGNFKFIACSGYIKGLSGILKEQKPQHLNRIFNELLQFGDSVEIINVNTITFDDLIKKYNINHAIDYLSIDTEGAEYSILKTINFDKHFIKTISVENNYTENNVHDLLIKNNFKRVASLGCDDIYVNVKI